MIYTVGYEGERLDRIAKKLLGTERNGSVEAILDANPGLAALSMAGGMVPEGTVIVIPDFEPVAQTTGIVLAWE